MNSWKETSTTARIRKVMVKGTINNKCSLCLAADKKEITGMCILIGIYKGKSRAHTVKKS